MLEKTDALDKERKWISHKMKQAVVDSFEIVKKSLKKNLLISSKILCYATAESEKELQVPLYWYLDLFFYLAVNCGTCRLELASKCNVAS